MKHLLGIMLVGGLGVGALLLAGCSTTSQNQRADADAHAFHGGMMCPGCETVWVTEKKTHGPRQINRLHSTREMTCETCDTTAQSVLLSDGKVQLHNCPDCKVTPVKIEPSEKPTHFHPKKGRSG